MAQLGNTGINGNLMVVGKIVTNNINATTINCTGNIGSSTAVVNCKNIVCEKINGKNITTFTYDSATGILTINGGV